MSGRNSEENLITKKSLFFVIIILAGFFAYINVYQNQFVLDDEFYIQKNTFIRSFSNLGKIFATNAGAGAGRRDNFYRPIRLLAYTFVYAVFGLKTWPYHLLNVCLHIANAALIFLLLKKIFKKQWLAFLTALFWVIHPVHIEAVTYASATQDPLALFFMLASFLFYINFCKKKQISLLTFSLFLFVLALLSKESAVIFPILLLVYELISPLKNNGMSKYQYIIPFLILSLIYFLLRLTVLNFGSTLNLYEESNIYTQNLHFRIFTFLATLPSYYSFLFWPTGLHMERSFPVFTSFLNPHVFVSFFIVTFLLFWAWNNRKSENLCFSFGALWFFTSFIPVSGIIPLNALILEHWLYVPSIGFFLVFSGLLCKLKERRDWANNLLILASGLIVVVLVLLTFARNRDWRNPITFYNNILQYGDGTARIHNNLAMAYSEQNQTGLAESHYLRAIEISDVYPQTHYNLARLYVQANKFDEAILHLERSLQINPHFFFSWQLLGDIYQFQDEEQKAQECYQKAQQIQYY